MAVAVDSLWSPDIKPTIQSPRTILEVQARAISQQTNGLLNGDVRVSQDDEKNLSYLSLDIVVPALDNYRHRILTATHERNMIYPVRIDADYFAPSLKDVMAPILGPLLAKRPRDKDENEAGSDEEFRLLVGHILRSHQVKAALVSLIARANEVLSARDSVNGQATSVEGRPPSDSSTSAGDEPKAP